MYIYNAEIHTMEGVKPFIGYVGFENGKITSVGEGEPADIPSDSFDAGGKKLFPGFIDPHSHIGLIGDGMGVEGEDVTIENAPQLVGTYEHPAYETFDVENRGGRLWFSYGSFETPLSFAKADGMICGYTGRLDGLVPDHIELWPDGNDLRLRTSDSELKMLFRKIK